MTLISESKAWWVREQLESSPFCSGELGKSHVRFEVLHACIEGEVSHTSKQLIPLRYSYFSTFHFFKSYHQLDNGNPP